MNLRRFVAAASAGVVGLLAVGGPAPVVLAEECTAESFSVLPTTYGLDTCVGNNLYTILAVLASTQEECSLVDLLSLESNTAVTSLVTLVEDIIASPAQISSLIYQHMVDTTATKMGTFCTTMNDILSPCLLALLPQLLPVLQSDLTCCSEVSDLIDLLNFFVPADVTTNYFVLNELVNGINQFFCSEIGTTYCGTNMYSQLTSKYTASTFTLLNSVVLPFVTIPSGSECSAVQGNAYTDTASLASASTIDYSCCIHHMRPLIQSIQSGFEYFFGDNVTLILNGMIDFSASGGKFVDSIPGTESCTFTDTCTDPSYLIATQTKTQTPGTNNPGKNDISDVTCTSTQVCDSTGTTCSTVCEKGTASVSTWLNSTLAYQRKLANSQKLCYAQVGSTHNSAITLADGYGNRDQLFNLNLNADKAYSYLKTNNHVLGLSDQLNIGMRWIEVDTHYFLDDFHVGHCGNLGSASVETFFEAFEEQLASYGTITWASDLLGCFPSVSGIKVNDQIKTQAAMQEIKDWVDDHPTEFVFVYLDTGDDISRLDKFDDLNTLLEGVFGDLIVPESELKTLASGSWKSGSIQTFIDAGHRVMLLANSDTGLAYSLYSYCGGHQVLTTDYINTLPSSSRQINGITIYGNSYLVRSYQAELRYISLSDEGTITEDFETFLEADNIGNFVRWNLNLVATDMVDGAKMGAQVWTWAANEPSTTASGAYVLINTSGRWIASTTAAKTYKACWSNSSLAWSIVSYSASCASGYTFTAPQDPYQNYLLNSTIATQGITIPVVINATLS